MANLALIRKNFTFLILFTSFFYINTALAQVPTISTISPTSGVVGTYITISGSNFNTTTSNSSVYFGAVKATPSAGTANSLTVTVPAGASPLSATVVQDNITGLQANSTETVAGTFARQLILTNTPELVPSYSNRNFGSNKISSDTPKIAQRTGTQWKFTIVAFEQYSNFKNHSLSQTSATAELKNYSI